MMLVEIENVQKGDFVRMTTGFREVVHVDAAYIWINGLRVARPGVRLTTRRSPAAYTRSQLRRQVGDFAHRIEGSS